MQTRSHSLTSSFVAARLELLEDRLLMSVHTPAPVDDFGSTTAAAPAYALSGPAGRTVNGTFEKSKDVDVMAFTASGSGRMRLEMTPTLASLGYTMTVLDASGSLLVNKTSTGVSNVTYVNVLNGQKLYVKLTGASGKTGKYSVKADMYTTGAVPTPDAGLAAQLTVLAQVLTLAGGSYLVIEGTSGNDCISVSQSGTTLSVSTNTTTQTFTSAVTGIQILGFDGADTIKVKSNVTLEVTAWGGNGDDLMYLAGSGADMICGGAGNDKIVSIGGGGDMVYGESGTDSLWADSKDGLFDADGAETAGGYVHSVSAFYQPYTTNSASSSYVSLELAGQNLQDPKPTSTSYKYVNFGAQKLFSGIQYNDVAQGGVGDCYYVASLAGLAQADPNIISQAITDLGDGTFAVRFYNNAGQPQYVRVDADLPVVGGRTLAYADLGAGDDLWVPLMEKAYAYYRTGANTYASIGGGWMSTVYAQITGRPATDYNLSSKTTDQSVISTITSALAAHKALSAGSIKTSGPILGSHAYMIKSIQTVNGSTTVTLFNPWGIDGAGSDGNPNDGLVTIPVSKMKTYFYAISIS